MAPLYHMLLPKEIQACRDLRTQTTAAQSLPDVSLSESVWLLGPTLEHRSPTLMISLYSADFRGVGGLWPLGISQCPHDA